MAARYGIAQVAAVPLAAATAKTVLQLVAAGNHAIRLVEIFTGFHGVANTDEPITVKLIRQTDAGTMSALTLNKADDSIADTLDTTAQHTATAEPTGSEVSRLWTVHPQTGLLVQQHDLGPLVVGATGRMGLVITAPDANTVDAYILFEE